MYSHKYNLIIGFHGCDEKIRDKIVACSTTMEPSDNDYDWLGHGLYFWENNQERALEWAQLLKENPQSGKSKITTPAVLGAVIDLGYCLDLLKL